ncbi:ClbS/DfsB family four-helix bundle protein [Lacticaseibacillus parakribbianus]|uniref:ClbS/DfsB family four-helix bundle protein n=1 Tax=Lacticaseibacillus parakribbianus TaxID=2970927 RepID=UPI0021CB5A46|nr:ClbS/DfsB family four-helix bundle protein [Lacticaseibacillus parakribbianus]
MAKPQTRQDLILSTYRHHDRLVAQVDALSPSEQAAAFAFKGRDHNLRDVFVQLAAWEDLYLDWSQANLAGDAKRFLPQPYTWQTVGKLGRKIQAEHVDTTLSDARQLFESAYGKIMDQYEQLTNEQLFLRGFYPWTGSMALGEYAAMVSSQHFAWGIKVLDRFAHQLAEQHAVASN